ncbi:MAG: R3H domain-containing nucleic acid-binding protein [Patescibacteria group bacterium]|jgi:spoIIIJ-associated protein
MNEINATSIEEVKGVVEDLILKMGINGKTNARIDEKEGKEIVCLNIEADDANYLIGQRGCNLFAIQHLAKVFLKRKNSVSEIPFYIDVNNYRQEKEEYLKKIALDTAEKVVRINKEIVLRPMTAYERRVVHMCLANNELVCTESIGEDPNRKIVIKPRES